MFCIILKSEALLLVLVENFRRFLASAPAACISGCHFLPVADEVFSRSGSEVHAMRLELVH